MGYYVDVVGPAIYDTFFDHGREGARALMDRLQAHVRPEMNVLDVGTGTGFAAFEAAKLVPRGHVVGIDMEEQAIALAQYKARRLCLDNLSFEIGDARQLRFQDEHFDVVLGSQVIGSPEMQSFFMAEMVRVLKPSGVLGLVRPNPPGSALMEFMNDTTLRMSKAANKEPPELFASRSADPNFVSQLLTESKLHVILCDQFVVANSGDFAKMTLNLIAQSGTLSWFTARALHLQSDDKQAVVNGILEYLETGQKVLAEEYGGELELECTLAMATKPA